MDKLMDLNQGNTKQEEDYDAYFKMIGITKELKKQFCNKKFNIVIKFLTENSYFNNSNLIKEFEQVFITNIDKIDNPTKSRVISYLSIKVLSNNLTFNLLNWEIIFDNFTKSKSLNTESYFHIIISLDAISTFLSNTLDATNLENNQFYSKYNRFFPAENSKFFNMNVEITTTEEIVLLSKLFHSKLLHFQYISDYKIKEINSIFAQNKHQLSIKISLVLPCLLVLYQELYGKVKTSVMFKETIPIMNDHMFFIFNNYDFLDPIDIQTIDNLSDNLFYYCFFFMKDKDFDLIFGKILHSYLNRVKSNENINWLNEIKLLTIISNQIKYKDKLFWNEIINSIKLFMLTDFDSFIKKMFKTKSKRITDGQNDNFNNFQITGLFYIGLFIELLSSLQVELKQWDFILDLLKKHNNFKQKDIFYNIQFIFFHCYGIYSNPQLLTVWNQMIPFFNVKIKRILHDQLALQFFMKTLFEKKSVDPKELSEVMNRLFLQDEIKLDRDNETYNKVSNVELFCVIYELLDNSLRSSNTVINNKIMSNTFVDLIKLENSVFSGLKFKSFIEKIKISEYDLFKETIFERIKSYLDYEVLDNSHLKLIIIFQKCGLFTRVDIAKLLFVAQKKPENNDRNSAINLLKDLLN